MERAEFIERIKDRKLINSDTAASWEDLSESYPYAALVRLMAYQKKGIENKSTRNAIALHFENPLHLNQLMAQYEVPTADKNVKPTPEVTVSPVTDAEPKKTPLVHKIKESISKEAPKNEALEKAEDIEVKQEPMQTPEVVESKVEEVKEAVPMEEVGKKEDVLELINNLPEENPLKSVKEQVDKVEKVEEIEQEKEESEPTSTDPQHLMVMMSFTDWLQYYKTKNENEKEDQKGRNAIRSAWQKEKLAEAMDDEEDVVPDEIFEKAMKSVSFGDGLVTETLAELYVKQEKIDKAIELYKKLSLLNPEKKAYFASRIKDLHL